MHAGKLSRRQPEGATHVDRVLNVVHLELFRHVEAVYEVAAKHEGVLRRVDSMDPAWPPTTTMELIPLVRQTSEPSSFNNQRGAALSCSSDRVLAIRWLNIEEYGGEDNDVVLADRTRRRHRKKAVIKKRVRLKESGKRADPSKTCYHDIKDWTVDINL